MGCERVGGVEGGGRLLEFCLRNEGVRNPDRYHIKINKYQFSNPFELSREKHQHMLEECVTFITTEKFRTS